VSRTARAASPALWLDLTRRLEAYLTRPADSPFGDVPEAAELGALPVMLDMWALILLRPDGAVFEHNVLNGTVRELGEGGDRWATLRAVARELGLPELAEELLPERPPDAAVCGACAGRGDRELPTVPPLMLPCGECGSLGWVHPSITPRAV